MNRDWKTSKSFRYFFLFSSFLACSENFVRTRNCLQVEERDFMLCASEPDRAALVRGLRERRGQPLRRAGHKAKWKDSSRASTSFDIRTQGMSERSAYLLPGVGRDSLDSPLKCSRNRKKKNTFSSAFLGKKKRDRATGKVILNIYRRQMSLSGTPGRELCGNWRKNVEVWSIFFNHKSLVVFLWKLGWLYLE